MVLKHIRKITTSNFFPLILAIILFAILFSGCDSGDSGSDDFTLTFGGDTYVLSKIYVDSWLPEAGDNGFYFMVVSEGINIEENSGSGAVVRFEINIGSAEVPSGVYEFSDFAEASLIVIDSSGSDTPYDITAGEVEISVSSGSYSVSGSVTADTIGSVDFSFTGQSSGVYPK